MAVLLVALITFGVIISGIVTLANATAASAEQTALSIRAAAATIGDKTRTQISQVTRCETALGTTIEFAVENTGQANLKNFAGWDLIAFYQSDGDNNVEYLDYTPDSTVAAQQWTISEIQMSSGAAEVIERGVLNPGERAIITAELPSTAWADDVNEFSLATDNGESVEISFDGANECAYYLHDNPTPPTGTSTAEAGLSLDDTYPSQATLYNYDADRDNDSGLLVLKGGSGAAETDLAKYQNWQTAALSEDLDLGGTVTVDIWAAAEDFSATSSEEFTLHLRDYNGSSYTEIASTTISSDPWDPGGTGTFVQASADISGLNYTVVAGNQLELKVTVDSTSDDDMRFAYDTVTYPAKLSFPDALRFTLESNQSRISTTTYYSLEIDGADSTDDWWYLHNNPTPPVGNTLSQADLSIDQTVPTATTLYNYDLDEDSEVGRVIAEGGSGPTESDLTFYQNWRTASLSEELRLSGTVSVVLWSAVKDFATGAAGEITVYLRDYDGSSYTEITNETMSVDPWDIADTGTWVERTVAIDSVDYTVAAGHRLEVKVIVGAGADDSMWFAYDTDTYQSRIEIIGDDLPVATTLPVDAGTQTGRFRPTGNEGRFLIPLRGYTGISDSEWQVTYLVRRLDGYGFQWLDTAIDITPATDGQWTDIDLSSSVPTGTTGAIIEVVNTHASNAFQAALRGKQDSRDYIALYNENIEGRNHRWQAVKVDSNRVIQGYNEDVSRISFKLVGYTYGEDPNYLSSPPDVTPPVLLGWTDVDVSAYVSAEADGVILLVDSGTAAAEYGVRESGSGDSDISHVMANNGNSMYMVGIDGNDVFQVYVDPLALDVHFFLIAETKGSVVYYADDLVISDPTLNSWQEVDADTYSVPDAASGLIFSVTNDSNQREQTGFRHGDSSDDWNNYLWSGGRFQAGAGLNDSNVWDEYISDTGVDVSIAAYTIGTPKQDSDIHADIDVLIRQRTSGNIRAVLGTDVATTTDIAPGQGWRAYTGTFTPAPYTIVDYTDYLEIDLYAHVTQNDSGVATLEFRISDISPPAEYRTAIDNVALLKE